MVDFLKLRWCDTCKEAVLPHYEWEPIDGEDSTRVATCPKCHEEVTDPVDTCPFCERPKNYWHTLCPVCMEQFTDDVNTLLRKWINPRTDTWDREVIDTINEIYKDV